MNDEKKLTFFETLTMATGFTVGSGIITQTGIGISMTGRSVCLAFLVSAALFLLAFRPLFLMGTVLPKISASYAYARELLSEKMGGCFIYIYFLGRITIAILCISFAQYMAQVFPAFAGRETQKLWAVAVATIFYMVNLRGIKTAAQVQNLIFFILLAGMLAYVFAGLPQLLPGFTNQQTFFTGGGSGFYAATSLFFFAVSGSYILVDFAPKIKDCETVMPKVIGIVTVSVAVLYGLLGVVASGTVELEEAANAPLTVSAKVVFAQSPLLFYLFLFGVCLGALVTTLNSSFVWYSNSLLQGCRDGWLPVWLARENRFGVPWPLMTLFYLFAVVPIMLGVDLTELSRMAISLTILSASIPMAGIVYLPEKYPELWENSGLADRYPKWRLWGMTLITYGILLTQIYSLLSQNSLKANGMLLIYCLIVGLRLLAGPLPKQLQKSKESQSR